MLTRRQLLAGAITGGAGYLASGALGGGKGHGWGTTHKLGRTTTTTPVATGAPSLDGRWYSADSSWNKPIPASPTIHSNSANFALGLKYIAGTTTGTETSQVRVDGSTTNPFAGATHVINLAYSGVPSAGVAQAGVTPTVTVRINYPPCGTEVVVPIPSSMDIQDNGLENSAVLMIDDGSEWDFFKITKPNVTPLLSDQHCFTTSDPVKWATASAIQHVDGVGASGWKGKGYGEFTPRASATYFGSGLIRPRDFQNPAGGHWDHAIGLIAGPISKGALSTGESSGTFWPGHVLPFLVGAEDNNVNTMKAVYCAPYGARWQLDPSLAIDQLNNDGTFTGAAAGNAPEWKKQYCRTLQTYGAFYVDSNSSGGGTGVTSEFQYPYTLFLNTLGFGNGTDDNIPPSLAQYLRVLDWNDSSNY